MYLLKQGPASTLWVIILLDVMDASTVFGEKVPRYRARKVLGDGKKGTGSKRALKPAEETEGDPFQLGKPTGLPEGHLILKNGYKTLFDPRQNIPLYSAYSINSAEGQQIGTYRRGDAKIDWIVDIQGLTRAPDVYAYNLNQGKINMLEKGHMNPSEINSFSKLRMSNTYRYSNAVPQYRISNAGPWANYERLLAKFAKEVCAEKYDGAMYIFTGTSRNYVGKTPPIQAPANMAEPPQPRPPPKTTEVNELMEKLKALGLHKQERVVYPTIVIPRSIWTAACCVSKAKTLSMAVMTNNHWNDGLLEQTEMTVAQLQVKLKEGMQDVAIFPLNPSCTNGANSVTLSTYDFT